LQSISHFHRRNSYSSLDHDTMRSILTVAFVPALMLCTQAQTWAGTYAVDSTVCNDTQCCCFIGTIIFTHPKPSVLRIISELNGTLCFNLGFILLDLTYPSGFVASFGDGPEGLPIALSADSRTVTIDFPPTPVCNSKALRVSNLPTSTTVATTAESTGDTGKLAISSMGIVAGILFAAINRMPHG
jgi:hypothetical protein